MKKISFRSLIRGIIFEGSFRTWGTENSTLMSKWVVQDSMDVFRLCYCDIITSSYTAHCKQNTSRSRTLQCERVFRAPSMKSNRDIAWAHFGNMIIYLKRQVNYIIPKTFIVNLMHITKTMSLWAGGNYYLVVGGCHDTKHNKNRNFSRLRRQSKLGQGTTRGESDNFTQMTSVTLKQSAGVAPEVNLRNSMQSRKWRRKKSTRLWNPGQRSPEVQNRGYQWPTKRTCVLQNVFF